MHNSMSAIIPPEKEKALAALGGASAGSKQERRQPSSAPAAGKDELAGTPSAEISFFKSPLDQRPAKTITIADFARAIRVGDYAKPVERVREIFKRGDKFSTDAAKRQLPAVAISGVSVGLRKQALTEGRFRHSGMLQIDIDDKAIVGQDPAQVRDILGQDQHIIFACLSPTGSGVKGIIRVPVAQTEEEHKAAFHAAERYFAAQYQIKIDASTKDPGRLCYYSFDPDAICFDGAEELAVVVHHVETLPEMPAFIPKPAPQSQATAQAINPDNYTVGGSTEPLSASEVRDMLAAIPPRPPYDEWLKVASATWDVLGEIEGTAALKKWSPEERPGEYSAKFTHRLKDVHGGSLVMLALQHGYVRRRVAPPERSQEFHRQAPRLIDLPYSDAGNSERLQVIHGANIRHVSSSGQWLVWNGVRWKIDENGEIIRRFIQTMRQTARDAVGLSDPEEAQAIASFALRSTNRAKVESGIALAKSLPGITVSVGELDADPWLVGCGNGAIDLRAGAFLEPRREHLITKSIGAAFDPAARCPTWEKFLRTVTNGDTELVEFLQSAIGYTLTGSTSEQCLFFLHGTGQNGKGVFSETVKRLSGDYGQTAPESLFTKDRNSSATNDAARLTGCRMAIAAELDEGAAFAESRLKALTGGDTITARFLHHEFFDFQPTHKFWISGNHKPTVKGTDFGIWRRIRLIPFTIRIPETEKDTRLADKLAAELPGILNWAIEGCRRWQREGLLVPQCVKRATESYRREEDVVGQFLSDCTLEESGTRTLSTSLYEAYGQWATREGIQERFRLNARKLARRIEEHGFNRVKSNGVLMWESMNLNTP